MDEILEQIREELRQNADDHTKISGQRFFKEAVKVYGVKTAIVTRIGKEYLRRLKNKNKAEIFSLCEELWQSGYMEESFIACEWAYALRKDYKPADFAMFETWIDKYVNNWASCDTLCNHSVGAFLEMYTEYLPQLQRWAKSDNRWLRRAAAVSLVIPARQGKFLADIFAIADILLMDKDDLVQKGYGWMLKEASRQHQQEVHSYVMKNKQTMPRTALRYAIEKMPADLKKSAMEK